MLNNRKGFTLIELLVVIAIIGVMSSVVMASLNNARSKGKDASIKASMSSIRSQVELYYDNNGNSYAPVTALAITTSSNICTTQTAVNNVLGDVNVKNALLGIDVQNGTDAVTGAITCVASSTGWAVSSPLNLGGNWCVDYKGNATNTKAIGAGCF